MGVLQRELIAGLTVLEVGAAVLIVALIVIVVGKLTGKREQGGQTIAARCTCGWQGNTSRLVRRCPLCNSPLHT